DGSDPQELALDALTGPGRIVVKSAGNGGAERRHGRVDIVHGQNGSLSWNVSAYTPSTDRYNYFDLDAWYPAQDTLSASLVSPGGQVLGPVPLGYYTPAAISTPEGAMYAENGVETSPSGARHLFVEVWDPSIGQA